MNLKNNPTSRSPRIKVCITTGDPSGIGPAVTLKALPKLKGLADFTVIGDSFVILRAMRRGGTGAIFPKGTEFIDLKNVRRKGFVFGRPRAEYGKASVEYIDKALRLLKIRAVDCLVTCPVSKEAVNLAGVRFSGHTEYLAERSGVRYFQMLLMNKELKVSLASRHIPLKSVPAAITQQSLYKSILITHLGLKKYFGIKEPRLVVCGLNPHASDNGLIGDEEDRVIKPVIAKLKYARVRVTGPLSADVAIRFTKDKKYDCAIAMYHDQALIPLKLSGSSSGVNLTLGLPFVRTSPLHGTAFDIAGSPSLADPSSLIAAIQTAVRCASNLKKA